MYAVFMCINIAGAYAAAGAAMAAPLLAQAQLVVLLMNSPGYSLCR